MKRFFHPLAIFTSVACFAAAYFVNVANGQVERSVQLAARHNFSAADLLTNIQIQGERMRRYEKEMFIYAAVPDKRTKYVKDFDDAYGVLLDLLNQAQASQHKGFSQADRQAMMSWVEAASFYGNEFRKVAAVAEAAPPDQTAALTSKLNADIGPGKDKFAVLLKGSAEIRSAKLKASTQIGEEVKASFDRIDMALFGVAAAMSVIAFAIAGRRPKEPAPQQARVWT